MGCIRGSGALVGLVGLLLIVKCDGGEAEPEKLQFEAAFQGRCDENSPCQQLCYELHDGMYECDCREGFILREDGYSCYEINSTALPPSIEDLRYSNAIKDILYQKDAVIDVVEFSPKNMTDTSEISKSPSEKINFTTQGPCLEQKMTSESSTASKSTKPVTPPPADNVSVTTSTVKACSLDCGPGGGCSLENLDDSPMCLCPLGRGGDRCDVDKEIQSPRFTGSSWLAFPALRGAYKHVQLSLELRPEAYDGIFFLTGERDDMEGDFMALLLHQGFVEFRFDCGSGVGVVRSEETILLNQWNHITLYRHRWDAWLQLNLGKHVQGRSKGLFSRITFREPLFIGGPGNMTGLSEKLPVSIGMKGCIRHLELNDHAYKFASEPQGEATKGYGIVECTADRCSHVPCQHGGKCLTNDNSAICLCPLGFSGDLCEIRVDLQVPSFNGSSHLRYRGLGESALTWLDLDVTFKPTAPDGLLLYNGHRIDGGGDFVGLYLEKSFLIFKYNLGTGSVAVKSQYRVSMGEWHQLRISRTGRLAILTVDNQLPMEVLSPGAFTQLSLPQNLYLGGVPNFGIVSSHIKTKTSFVGCIQQVRINGKPVSILAEALGGANVDNCPHPCVARPCGEDGECVPEMEYFSCKCKPGYRDHLCSRGPPYFHGTNSYIHLNDMKTMDAISTNPFVVNVRFKISSISGLLLCAFDSDNYISLGLENGALVLRFSDKEWEEEIKVVHNSTTVNDRLWHRVKAVRSGSAGLLIVDNGAAITRQSVDVSKKRIFNSKDEGLYIGGMPQTALETLTKYTTSVIGCIADLVINTDFHLKMITHSEIGHNVSECEA
ncbi:pikachurin [Diorhabda sublineata]|uniref:pikachurin n=1 Tax=Diorhabda sublineata TaxID=1163346 RepID=UPI0024E14E1F|nr:pikachurin [Diorhabda sublineata]